MEKKRIQSGWTTKVKQKEEQSYRHSWPHRRVKALTDPKSGGIHRDGHLQIGELFCLSGQFTKKSGFESLKIS